MTWRALALVLAACESGSSGPPTVVENTGRICLLAAPQSSGPQMFAAGAPVHVAYANEGECLSSSCTSERAASCTATSDSGAVEITSTATWRDTSAQQQACTDDCLQLGAVCTTSPMPAGTYEIRFGAGRLSLTVPSQHPAPPCIDAR